MKIKNIIDVMASKLGSALFVVDERRISSLNIVKRARTIIKLMNILDSPILLTVFEALKNQGGHTTFFDAR